jgi:hypothetical protein
LTMREEKIGERGDNFEIRTDLFASKY